MSFPTVFMSKSVQMLFYPTVFTDILSDNVLYNKVPKVTCIFFL